MENRKSLWEIVKGTIKGVDNEGSAKRATSFYVVTILLTLIVCVYSYRIIKATGTTLDEMIIKMFPSILYALIIFVVLLLGLATVESVTNLIRTIKGGSDQQGQNEQK